jgi:hypothetical protein
VLACAAYALARAFFFCNNNPRSTFRCHCLVPRSHVTSNRPLQAIPLLLYAANLKRMLTETGRLLPAFFLGSATTVMGSLAAWILLPLGRFLGEAGWQVGQNDWAQLCWACYIDQVRAPNHLYPLHPVVKLQHSKPSTAWCLPAQAAGGAVHVLDRDSPHVCRSNMPSSYNHAASAKPTQLHAELL